MLDKNYLRGKDVLPLLIRITDKYYSMPKSQLDILQDTVDIFYESLICFGIAYRKLGKVVIFREEKLNQVQTQLYKVLEDLIRE